MSGASRRLNGAGQNSSAVTSSPRLALGDRLQPVVLIGSIAVGLALAKAAPGVANSMSTLVSVGVVLLIFLVMLGVDAGRVAAAFKQRRFLAIAVTVNFVINPLLAWGLGAVFLSGEPELRVGLILFLVTPCIGWYLVFTELAGGDTGLGVSLLGVNIVLQVLLLPLYLAAFAGQASSVDPASIVAAIVLFLILPAWAAELTRRGIAHRGADVDELLGRLRVPIVKTVTLAVIIVSMFASQGDVLFDSPAVVTTLLPPLVAFFVIAFVAALIIGRIANLPYDQTALLAFTTTSRNSEVSIAIAATAFSSPLVGLTVVIGPVIELPLLVVMVRVLIGLRPPLQPTATSIAPSTHLSTSTQGPRT